MSKIDGVRIASLKLVANQRGRLMEVQHVDDDLHPGFGQTYVTATFAGVVKAWYLHRAQVDQIAVIAGCVKLVLYDVRATSPTYGTVQEIVLAERDPQLVQIPTGIWHGFQALGVREAILLHLNSRPHRLDQPDEERRPADDPSIPYKW